MITDAVPPPELGLGDEPMPRISVFMNVFNCHINRMPVTGTVLKSLYRTGQFLSADLDKAAEANERQSLLVETEDGKQIVVVQIAGLVARRICASPMRSKKCTPVSASASFGSGVAAMCICRKALCRVSPSGNQPWPVKPCWPI